MPDANLTGVGPVYLFFDETLAEQLFFSIIRKRVLQV
jgi:hypothetical protein